MGRDAEFVLTSKNEQKVQKQTTAFLPYTMFYWNLSEIRLYVILAWLRKYSV